MRWCRTQRDFEMSHAPGLRQLRLLYLLCAKTHSKFARKILIYGQSNAASAPSIPKSSRYPARLWIIVAQPIDDIQKSGCVFKQILALTQKVPPDQRSGGYQRRVAALDDHLHAGFQSQWIGAPIPFRMPSRGLLNNQRSMSAIVRKLHCEEPFRVPSVLLVIDGDEKPSVEIEVFECATRPAARR